MKQYEAANREQFAAILRAVRADRSLRSYGRLDRFGRVLVADQFRVSFSVWTNKPPMNIHRLKQAGVR